MSEPCDPVCLIHGKRMSEHKCLYCLLCYRPLTVAECHVTEDGERENVCEPCAENEKRRLENRKSANHERTAMKTTILILAAAAMLAGCDFRLNVNTQPNPESVGTNSHTIYLSTNKVFFETNVVIEIPGQYRIRWGVNAP